jgi:DNA transformation protein
MSDTGFVDHCIELLSGLGHARAKRMFGGHGIWIDDMCMALIIGDTLYLKTDAAHRPDFEAAGSHPFTYSTREREVHVTSYFTAPDAAMESPAEMAPWGRRALAAAVAARAKKPKSRKAAGPRAPAKPRRPKVTA